MSDCCSSSCQSSEVKKKSPCPHCQNNGTLVSTTTIEHHLKQAWHWQAPDQTYYFCDSTDCAVAYFSDDSIIQQSELRLKIGIKTQQADDLICYCYGVSLRQAKENPEIKAFVVDKTKQSNCACETRNPSGRCCLKDFPKKAQ